MTRHPSTPIAIATTSPNHEAINHGRRKLIASATMGLAVAVADSLFAIRPAPPATNDSVRPFHVNIPEADLADLRQRLAATRWPDKETVADDSQGVPLAMLQDLVRYWRADYDWRKVEARLNELPQFITEIDGLDIHFIHVRSKHEKALPMIVTHGWPGSVIEQLKIVDPLANPTANGATTEDAFDLVIPSMPGYGFSGKPTTTGWDPTHIARAWIVLMKRLGYTKFVAQGGDWGSPVSNEMAKLGAPELLGIHVNLPAVVPPDVFRAVASGEPAPANLSAEEKHAFDQLKIQFAKRRAYAQIMGTRPQTLSALTDSPAGLAAWLLDHGDGYAQPASAMTSAVLGHTINGHSAGALTRDDVLDNITLYWLTNTPISSARLYWENKVNFYLPANVTIPAAVTAFPGESFVTPRSWAEKAYQKLIYFHQAEAGGHFAAWEQPAIFSREVRDAFRPLRSQI